MARIPILGSTYQMDDDLDALRSYYGQWRKNNSAMKSPFFALFRSFKEQGRLRDLSEGALRLYLYFGFSAGNDDGTSWHSIQTIAKYFKKQTRTIDNWISELADAGLIFRTRDGNKSHTTFLIPYTDAVMNIQPAKKHDTDDQAPLDDLMQVIKNNVAVYGRINNVFHIFHWGADRKARRRPNPESITTNYLLIITQRSDGVLVGHRYYLRKSAEYGVSQLNIDEDEIAVFDSSFNYGGRPVIGIAVSHKHRLMAKESTETIIEMVQDLSKAEDDTLFQHQRVVYGLISDVLTPDEEDPQEQESEGGGDE